MAKVSSRVRLTDAAVRRAALPPGKTDLVVWDSELTGFGLRLRPAGKTYIVAFRPAGSGRAGLFKRMRIGTPDTFSTATEARARARIILGQIAIGVDPLAERTRGRVKTATVGHCLDRYARDLERRNYVKRRDVLATLRGRMTHLLGREIAAVTTIDLTGIVDKLTASGRVGAAQDFRARCRTFLGWSLGEGLVSTNALAGIRRQRSTRADRIARAEHGRALSDDELAKVWMAADPTTTFGRLIRFYVLTGCRRGEGAGLTWLMVDMPVGVINLPAVFTKQGRGHLLTVAPALAEILDQCTRGSTDLVFPSSKTGGQISGWTKHVASIRAKSGVDFGLHDLRRTFRTGLSRLGVDADTAELALGHAREELEQIYNRDTSLPKIRAAFELWARHVITLA